MEQGLVDAIETLQNPTLSLVESLQIVDDVHTHQQAVSVIKNNRMVAKLYSVL